MILTLQFAREHSFLNQIRRSFVLKKGSFLTGDLRLFASTWPFGVFDHETASRLGVEFTFLYEGKRWLYRGTVDCRELWPAQGGRVRTATESDASGKVGPLVGMLDNSETFSYILPDGIERSFRLQYVGFELWVSCPEVSLNIILKHFLPGEGGDVMVAYSIPLEDVLFQKELKVSHDAEGFVDDAYECRPFVRVEECSPN